MINSTLLEEAKLNVADLFMDYFVSQCATYINDDVLKFKANCLANNPNPTDEEKILFIFNLNRILKQKYYPVEFEYLTLEEWDLFGGGNK
jgi:hypothetical protein